MAATRMTLLKSCMVSVMTTCTIVSVAGQAQLYNYYQPPAAGYNNYQPAADGYNNYQPPAAGYNPYQPSANPYANYQIPSSPALNSYGSQPQYDRKCSDLNCKIEECCIETHRGSQCIGLTKNTATNQSECARPKKCSSSSDCAAGFCCVWAIDTTVTQTCPKSPAPFNGYGNAAPSYGNGYGSAAQNEGWCFKAVGSNEPCWVPLPGQAQKGCPCKKAKEVCVPIIDPFTVGTCRAPLEVTSWGTWPPIS